MDRDCQAGPLFDLFDLLVFSCSLVMHMLDLNAFRRRHPTRTALMGILTSAQLLSGDDLTNDIIKLELKDAKDKWLCNSFKDLTKEMQLLQ